MDDADFKAQEKRVLDLSAVWKPILGLTHWEITYDFYHDAIPGYEDSSATSAPRWQYLTATIRWNCYDVKEMTNEKLEWTFVHEMAHILVNEMRHDDDGPTPHEERVCSVIASALLAARNVHLFRHEVDVPREQAE